MPSSFIPFAGWSPSGGYFGEGWNAVRNLYPAYDAWRPWRKFLAVGSGVADGPMTGRHIHIRPTGAGTGAYFPDTQTLYTGSTIRLYTVDPATGAFTDVSRAAAYTSGSAGWRFASVGNDIWATDWIDALQRRTANAGLFANGLVSTFKPKPRFIATIREHLVWANDSAGRPDDWGWSDADDATNMDPATATGTSLAGRPSPLVSIPGQFTGLLGGQYGLLFKATGVYYLEYAGPPQIIRPEILSPTVGTMFPSSIINSRYGIFFLGPDGFYKIDGLAAPVKISPPGVDQVLLDSTFSQFSYGFFTWQEDIQAEGFQSSVWPMVGWLLRLAWLEHGNNIAIIYNPIRDAWAILDVADANPEEGLAARPTAIFDRPYAPSQYERLAALTWDGSLTKYAPLAASGAAGNIFAPSLALNFRPANKADAPNLGQSIVKRVLPMISKTAVAGTALTPQVTVEPMLNPFDGVYGSPEVRPATERSPNDGSYPVQRGGLYFRASIQCAAEDFANFHGAWVDQELLT